MFNVISKANLKRKMRTKIVFVFLLSFLVMPLAHAESTQYDVTAVLISKLINYVSWPDENMPKQSKIKFCIIEDPNTISIRSSLLTNKSLQNNFVILPRNSLSDCEVIFIGEHPKQKLLAILSKIQNTHPVLTFSASENFARTGVMINFYTEDQKVRFEINWDVMKAAELKISSRVLKLARIVK